MLIIKVHDKVIQYKIIKHQQRARKCTMHTFCTLQIVYFFSRHSEIIVYISGIADLQFVYLHCEIELMNIGFAPTCDDKLFDSALRRNFNAGKSQTDTRYKLILAQIMVRP